MPSNEPTYSGNKTDSKHRSAKPAPENLDLLAQKQIYPATLVQQAEVSPGTITPGNVLQLQQALGNQAVQRLLGSHTLQAKLTVGAAKDSYEQEADRVSAQVMSAPAPTSNVQHLGEEEIQAKPLAASITPLAQQKTGADKLPAKSMAEAFIPGADLESHLVTAHGSGQPLPGELRREMETKMGADFSAVRLHTNDDASQLNRRLAARALTQGKDIYLDSGRYNLSSREGKRLLAHELTHVLQQTGKQPPANGARQEQNVASRPSSVANSGVVQRDPDDDKLKAAAQKSDAPASMPAASASAGPYGSYIPPSAAPVTGALPAETASKKASDVFRDPKRARESMAVKLVEAAKKPHPDPIHLPEKFKDEDKKVGWRGRTPTISEQKHVVTRYYSDEERERNKLTPAMSTPPILRRAGRPEPGLPAGSEEKKLYAMSPAGQAILGSGPDSSVGEDGVKRNLHHSSIFAGGDVAHAGHIAAEKGKVNYMDDDSGHYRPDAVHTWDAYNRFKEQGQLSEKGTVSMVNKTQVKGERGYGSDRLNLPFSAYEQTYGNEEQARNKNAMQKQMLETVAKKRAGGSDLLMKKLNNLGQNKVVEELRASAASNRAGPDLFREGGMDKGYDYD
jgi:hypothetical protein